MGGPLSPSNIEKKRDKEQLRNVCGQLISIKYHGKKQTMTGV
jgi:hypothetical protein